MNDPSSARAIDARAPTATTQSIPATRLVLDARIVRPPFVGTPRPRWRRRPSRQASLTPMTCDRGVFRQRRDERGGLFPLELHVLVGAGEWKARDEAEPRPPQAAILAVGRIANRVVAVNGQPIGQATMVLTLSCDHRSLDGARGASSWGCSPS